jgi:DNA polymerase-1
MDTMQVVYIKNSEQWEEAERELLASPAVGFDIETTSLDPRRGFIRLMQFGLPDGRVFILDSFAINLHISQRVISEARTLIGHNLKFELKWLVAKGFDVPKGINADKVPHYFCTMLASQVLHAGTELGKMKGNGLDDVAQRLLNVKLDKTFQTSDWSGELTRGQYEYAAMDAYVVFAIARLQWKALVEANLMRTMRLEMRALPGVAWMEHNGFPINRKRWLDLYRENWFKLHELELRMDKEQGFLDEDRIPTMNWGSAQQLVTFFGSRGWKIPNAEEATIASLVGRDDYAQLVLDHKGMSKLDSTYGLAFLEKFVDPITGRVHPDFLQLGAAATGRLSSARPNGQNIDLRRRDPFEAEEGKKLISADYSQIELRIAAQIANERAMIEAYQKALDLHAQTSTLVMGKTKEQCSKDEWAKLRQISKSLNFGLLYGMGADKFKVYAKTNYHVDLTPEEAQELRNKWFSAYPSIKAWHRSTPEFVIETRTLGDRRRLDVVKFTEKLNTPVQGTGADAMKASIALFWENRHKAPPGFLLLGTIHDENLAELPEEHAEEGVAFMETYMTKAMETFLTEVPSVVEAKILSNWGEK